MILKKLGIEIRKIEDPKSFYKDIDSILDASGISSGNVTVGIQESAVAHSLQKMFNQSHFSICTIDVCSKISGIIIQKERYDIYHSIHCLHWNEMLPDFRMQIISMIMDDFRSVFGREVNSELSTINC